MVIYGKSLSDLIPLNFLTIDGIVSNFGHGLGGGFMAWGFSASVDLGLVIVIYSVDLGKVIVLYSVDLGKYFMVINIYRPYFEHVSFWDKAFHLNIVD
jgi:hypothetical protein